MKRKTATRKSPKPGSESERSALDGMGMRSADKSGAPIAEKAAAGSGRLMKLLAELDQWWGFDNAQQHTHSWHDKQDFLERWRAKAAEGGDGNAETRIHAASHHYHRKRVNEPYGMV